MKAGLSGRPVRLERGTVGGREFVSTLWQVRKWMIKGSGNDDWEPWNINSRDILVVDKVEGCLSPEFRLGRFGSEVSIMISRGHYEEASFHEVDNISSPRSPTAASLDGRVSEQSDSEGSPEHKTGLPSPPSLL